MIQNIIVCKSIDVEKKHMPKNDTLIINVGVEKVPDINYDYLYFDSLALSFAADILPTNNKDTISNVQAQKIIKQIKKAHNTPVPIDILVCCDSKYVISDAIAMYIKDKHPKAKLSKSLQANQISTHIHNFLKMNSYRQHNQLFKGVSQSLDFKIIGNSIITITNQFKKDPKKSLKSIITWFKCNF